MQLQNQLTRDVSEEEDEGEEISEIPERQLTEVEQHGTVKDPYSSKVDEEQDGVTDEEGTEEDCHREDSPHLISPLEHLQWLPSGVVMVTLARGVAMVTPGCT